MVSPSSDANTGSAMLSASTAARSAAVRRRSRWLLVFILHLLFFVVVQFLRDVARDDGQLDVAVHDGVHRTGHRAVDFALHDAVDPHTAIAAAAGHQLRHGKGGTIHDAGADEQDLGQNEEDEEDGDDGASAQTLADAHDAGVGSHLADEDAGHGHDGAGSEAEENQVSEEVQVASAGASDYQAQKANQKEMRKLSRRIEQIENELETIEERLEEISAAMLETNDVAELSDLQKELDDLSVSQEALMEEWSDLSEQLEG